MSRINITDHITGTPYIRIHSLRPSLSGKLPFIILDLDIPYDSNNTYYTKSPYYKVDDALIPTAAAQNNAFITMWKYHDNIQAVDVYTGTGLNSFNDYLTFTTNVEYGSATFSFKYKTPDNMAPSWWTLSGNANYTSVGGFGSMLLFGVAVHFTDDHYLICRGGTRRVYVEAETKATDTKMGNVAASEITMSSSFEVNIPYDSLTADQYYKLVQQSDDILQGSQVFNPNNPYPGGDSTDPGNDIDGSFDYTSDETPIPKKPTTKVTDSGLVTLYAPTESQLKALGNYLWSDAFSLDSFKKLFNNPMDCILGLTMVPVKLPHGAAREITVGNIVSTVSCDICSDQYVDVDCGSFDFSSIRFTSSFLDFAPYTKCYLYLPFIGTNEISMDEWQNSTMYVKYRVDVLTGAMMCYVQRMGHDDVDKKVNLYESYTGQCSENVPLSSNDFSTTIGSILGVAATAAGAVATVATAGAAAPAAAAAGEASAAALSARTGAAMVGAGISTATNVGNAKPSIRHGSATGGGAGIMGAKYPYLIFIAPNMVSPNNQESYTGFPSNRIVKLSSCQGYTEIQAVNLKIAATNTDDPKTCTPAATDEEMREIKRVLESGVIF